VHRFVAENRDRILVDIVAELRRAAAPVTTCDRFSDWVQGVLARCGGDTAAIVRQNAERRGARDEDADEAVTIADALRAHVAECAVADVKVFVTATTMTSVVSTALHEPLSAKTVKSKLQGHIEAGRLPGVTWVRGHDANGYCVQRDNSEGAA
jgi:GGDEF domain-containing protein